MKGLEFLKGMEFLKSRRLRNAVLAAAALGFAAVIGALVYLRKPSAKAEKGNVPVATAGTAATPENPTTPGKTPAKGSDEPTSQKVKEGWDNLDRMTRAWQETQVEAATRMELKQKELKKLQDDIERLKNETSLPVRGGASGTAAAGPTEEEKAQARARSLRASLKVQEEMKIIELIPLYQAMSDEEAMELLRLMDPSRAAKILAGLATEQDTGKTQRVELLIRRGSVANLTVDELATAFARLPRMPEEEALRYLRRLTPEQVDRLILLLEGGRDRWFLDLVTKDLKRSSIR
ncbi:MAG: hypothetical protein V1809_03565 [Planctomycetota bacterium]